MPTQKIGSDNRASIAPGMPAIAALSTTSIVAMDRVSAARTTLSAGRGPRVWKSVDWLHSRRAPSACSLSVGIVMLSRTCRRMPPIIPCVNGFTNY
jgi:hypothetical protein